MLAHYYYVDGISFRCILKWNWSDEYSISGRIQKCGEGGKRSVGFWTVRAGARERKDTWSRGSREEGHLEPGLERGRTLGAGARERKDTWSRGSREEGHLEPGLERGRTLGAGARERKDTWSRGSREGVGAGDPNSEDGVGAGGPREEGCSKEDEHEEEEGLKRT